MNFDANNVESTSIIDKPKGYYNRVLKVPKTMLIIACVTTAIIYLIFLFGADLSVYYTEKTLSAGLFDRISDTNSTPYNMYDNKWIIFSISVMVLMGISVIITTFRYNKVPMVFADVFGTIMPAVFSLMLIIIPLLGYSYSDWEGISDSGLSYYERASEGAGAGSVWICIILVIYIICAIYWLLHRYSLASEYAVKDCIGVDGEEEATEVEEKAITTADEFFARYNGSTKEETDPRENG